MARTYADEPTVFRAVVVVTHPNGNTTTEIYGPYTTKGAASAQLGRVKRQWERRARWEVYAGASAAGWVESSPLVWTPVDK